MAAAQAPASAAPDNELGEIVVTAQRVESTVQRTPIAMDVLSSNLLKSQGVTSINALQSISPSLNITGNGGGGTVLTIRGVSSRDTTEIGDPAVVVSVDGFYNDRSYALGLTQYDLERIEVLRGPQGTLYGRNATGGAINIVTARPGLEPGGYVQVEGGNYSTLNAEGALNIPLHERVQMRVSFGTSYHSGYRQTTPFGDADDANARSGRFQIQVQPIDDLRIRFTAQHTTQDAAGAGILMIPYSVDAGGFVVHDMPALGATKAFPRPENGYIKLNDSAYRWDVVYDTPLATVTYLGGYDRLKWDNLLPNFFFQQPALPANGLNPPFQRRTYNQREKPVTTNHEFRLTNPDPEARLTWQAGVYYFKSKNHLDSFNFAPNGTPNPTPVIHFLYDVRIESLAEMIQVGLKVTDQLKITGGFRHNDDEKFREGYVFFAQTLPPNANKTTLEGEVKKNTYHAGVDYQIEPASLLYGKFDTGYKSGGFTDVAPYGPETVKTWEIGSKNRFWDNRLQLNVAGFYSKYTGQQVQQIVQQGGGLRIVNAGESRTYGVEADLTAVLPFGRFELNAAYLDAKFTDFLLASSVVRWNGTAFVSVNQNFQLAGNRPQQAPKWTLQGVYEKSWDDVMGGRVTARAQVRYQSKQYYSFFNLPDDTQDACAITNLNLAYQPEGARWQIMGYVRNLTDETVFTSAGPNDRNFNYGYSFQPPRTYGAQVSYRW
jgi:iron complex outermembrane receptor protein